MKSSAKARKLTFNLFKNEFEEWYNTQDKRCCYCGIDEDRLKVSGNLRSMLSIDRKDNNIGYEIANLCVACYKCNKMKGAFFTQSEWAEIANKFIVPRLSEFHKLPA